MELGLVSMTFGGGVLYEYHYDASGLLLRKRTQQSGQKSLSAYYCYDKVGQLLSINNGVVLLEYEYDALGRVTQESIDGKKTEYQYTANQQPTIIFILGQSLENLSYFCFVPEYFHSLYSVVSIFLMNKLKYTPSPQ